MTTVRTLALAALCLWAAASPSHAADTTAAQQLAHWSAQAGSPGNADKGKVFVSQPKGGGAKGGEGGSKPLAEMGDAERLQLAQQGKLKAAQAAD